MKTARLHSLLAALILASALSGCGSASSGIGSEVATTAVSGAASQTEGSVAFLKDSSGPAHRSFFDRHSLIPEAVASTCSSTMSAATCSNSLLTYNFGSTGSGCTVGSSGSVTWTGIEYLTFTSGTCANPASGSIPAAGAVFTRTADSTSPLVRSNGSNSVTLTTADSSGYSSSKTGGMTITCDATSGCSAGRTIAINGIHYVGSSVIGSWDHTVSTDTNLSITGTGSSRQITAGAVRVQHNKAKFTSVSTITSALTFTSGCCFPTGGAIKTTFSDGSNSGQSETMTYTSTCGSASLTDSSGKSSTVTLTHCL